MIRDSSSFHIWSEISPLSIVLTSSKCQLNCNWLSGLLKLRINHTHLNVRKHFIYLDYERILSTVSFQGKAPVENISFVIWYVDWLLINAIRAAALALASCILKRNLSRSAVVSINKK